MTLLNNYLTKNFFLLFIFSLILLSGCSTMINNQVFEYKYKKQLKKPTAKKNYLSINGIKRSYFLFSNKKNKDNSNNKQLILILSGSECLDQQPLLGLLYKDIPINSDIAVLQKRQVKEGSSALSRAKCTKSYYRYNNHVNRAKSNLTLIEHLKN